MSRPPAKPRRERLNISVDQDTLRVLQEVQKTIPEIDGPSAAVRYLARCYEEELTKDNHDGD
jgi:hypothetical protein